MKKTALQQAIREIAELWSSPSDQPNYVQVFDVLKSKLPVEEQQIIDAYWDGGQDIPLTEKRCEQYYNETFKQQEQ
jgi:hypothetical protein